MNTDHPKSHCKNVRAHVLLPIALRQSKSVIACFSFREVVDGDHHHHPQTKGNHKCQNRHQNSRHQRDEISKFLCACSGHPMLAWTRCHDKLGIGQAKSSRGLQTNNLFSQVQRRERFLKCHTGVSSCKCVCPEVSLSDSVL